MNTLHLVAPEYRETATLIPIFDYDVQSVDEIRGALLQAYGQKYGAPETVAKEDVHIARDGGEPPVRALLYRPATGTVRGAILHMHGGGWIGGTADMMASFCAGTADRHGVIVLSVDYRLAPEAPGDAALDDCFAALSWLRSEAGRLGFDPDRIVLMGDSAGGNLSAGIALRARDAKVPVAAQLLIYPALDDRTGGPDALIDNLSVGEFVLSGKYLHQLWQVRLAHAAPESLTYLAPARAEDLAGLAPAFIAMGSVDILIDEALDYTARLIRAGVSVELHVYPGVYHAFDLVPGAITDRFLADLSNAIDQILA